MKQYIYILVLICGSLFISCGESTTEKKPDSIKIGREEKEVVKKSEAAESEASEVPASQRITLDNKGVGPIKNLTLDPIVDKDMAARGGGLFKTNCTACHKTDKRFIGPSPKGILERRSPEWIMNMILNPQLMVEQDRCAKDLLVEFNGAAMANQNMTEEQAREILEYFRTL